jgi:Zn finger protein HypA/HybF involved in hydrogenase expression
MRLPSRAEFYRKGGIPWPIRRLTALEDECDCPVCQPELYEVDEDEDEEIEVEEMEVECPHCGETFTCEVHGEHVCPNCGNDVDVVSEDELSWAPSDNGHYVM